MNRGVKLVVIALGALILWAALAPWLADFLIVRRSVERSEAIVVMSGSAVYTERCKKAAELFRAGIAPVIYLSNDGRKAGWSSQENRNPFFVELAQRELVANGVTPDAIRILDGYVAGTDEEAAAFSREIEVTPQSSIVIVTSPYHTRRTLFAFEKSLHGRDLVVGIEHTDIQMLKPGPTWWWTSPAGIRDVVGEYVKLIAYWTYLG